MAKLTFQESEQIVKPLINKLSLEIQKLENETNSKQSKKETQK